MGKIKARLFPTVAVFTTKSGGDAPRNLVFQSHYIEYHIISLVPLLSPFLIWLLLKGCSNLVKQQKNKSGGCFETTGVSCQTKGWITENGTTPVKPGTGVAVAVKTLNHDGLQGHKEWPVREFIIKILFFLCTNIRLEIWAAFYFHFYDSKG